MHPSSILLVVGYPLIRHGIKLALGGLSWLAICGETGEASLARRLCEEHKPQLIVLDLELQNGNGLGMLRDLSRLHPAARMLALSEREDAPWVQRVFQAGAHGYVSKWDSLDDLSSGLSWLTMNEERFVGRRMSHHLMHQFLAGEANSTLHGLDTLSDREMEVFRLVGLGDGATAAARGLGMSVKTVETHHSRIKEKLGLRSNEDLKKRAIAWITFGRNRSGC